MKKNYFGIEIESFEQKKTNLKIKTKCVMFHYKIIGSGGYHIHSRYSKVPIQSFFDLQNLIVFSKNKIASFSSIPISCIYIFVL